MSVRYLGVENFVFSNQSENELSLSDGLHGPHWF